jgi:hypothetical protein
MPAAAETAHQLQLLLLPPPSLPQLAQDYQQHRLQQQLLVLLQMVWMVYCLCQ